MFFLGTLTHPPLAQDLIVPLTVLAITDEVSRSLYDAFDCERWRAVDLIVSCGDLPPEYLDFLVSSLDVPVFYVRGNHDGAYRASRYDGTQNIHGKIVQYRGIRIAGFEGSREYNHGPVQYSERQMKMIVQRARLQSLYKGVPNIVITHAPPAGPHSGDDRCHGGFEAFNTAIRAWQPSVLVHGHMHAYNGAQIPYTVGKTIVMNAYPHVLFEVAEPVAQTPPIARPQPDSRLKRLIRPHRVH
jgi:predicted phosphodiesterase